MKHRNFTNLKTKFAVAKLALLLAASFLAGTLATRPGATQTPPATPKYAVIEFMKAEPGKGADYVKAEREWWMPAHQEMVKQGRLKSWQLYGVRGSGTVSVRMALMSSFAASINGKTWKVPASPR